jgi:hypothetical protein
MILDKKSVTDQFPGEEIEEEVSKRQEEDEDVKRLNTEQHL